MEEEAGPSLSTANDEESHEVNLQQINDTSNVPEVAIPHEILQDVGAQNIFTPIEMSKLPGMEQILKTTNKIRSKIAM